MSNSKRRPKILFFLSGSIAAFKAAQVISRLVQDGAEVQTVATPGALKFIGTATLEGLTNKPVLTDLWEQGRAMDHIHLSRWADYGVLCPASANTIAKLAHGMADDLVSTLILAWPKGKALHVFPAMNVEMYTAKITQENISRLLGAGINVHPTSDGNLACGESGGGRMLEAEEILKIVGAPAPKRGKILITGGATREPIDGIRFLSNVSTGQTAAELSDQLEQRGWDVTYLHGQGARVPLNAGKLASFSSTADLEQKLRENLAAENFFAVIHCAAVSDYSVSEVNGKPVQDGRKLSSDKNLEIQLNRNPKLLPSLKEYSRNKSIRVVGFKLTLNSDESELLTAAQQLLGTSVDAVVANDWTQVDSNRERHPGFLLDQRSKSPRPFSDLTELAGTLDLFLKESQVEGEAHGPMS